ncbi:MAG: hypothetical protein WBA88_03870 [Pseudaminobacter sp.]
MRVIATRDAFWFHAIAALAFVVASAPNMTLMAQGLDSQKAIDTIIGSEVREEEASAKAEPDKIIAAIENTAANTSEVRKISNLDKVDIVFLPDAAENGLPPEVDAKVKEHEKEIIDLRKELEGNAMLFHAINSRAILMRDILAIEFDSPKSVIIYATAKPTG